MDPEIIGADRLATTLDRAAADLAAIDQTAGATAAEQVTRSAAQAAPRRTGVLANSHRAQANSVTVTAPYAGYVHWGTRHMPGRPWLSTAAERAPWPDAYADEAAEILNQIKGA